MPANPRRRIRKPLLDASGGYYTDADFRAVLEALPKPPRDLGKLRGRLEYAAEWYVVTAQRDQEWESPPPSKRVQHWARTHHQIAEAVDKIKAAKWAEQEVRYAAEELAETERHLPDFSHEVINIPSLPGCGDETAVALMHWPAHDQVDFVLERVDWLLRVLERAEQRAFQEKRDKGGNRPDQERRTFLRQLYELAEEQGMLPLKAWHDPVKGWQGHLCSYLLACFRPLGVRDDVGALVKAWQSANP